MTASKFHKRPSELAELDDPGIALAFDVNCAEILFEWESEQKQIELQAMLTGQIAKQFEGAANQIPEITQANFRDQAF